MKLIRTALVLIYMFNFSLLVKSQTPVAPRFTISGYVKDKSTGETMIGASIAVDGNKGIATNNYGFFSITVGKGMHQFQISYVGYENLILDLNVMKDSLVQF